MKHLLIAFVCFAFVGCKSFEQEYLIEYNDGSKEVYRTITTRFNGESLNLHDGCAVYNQTTVRCGVRKISKDFTHIFCSC